MGEVMYTSLPGQPLRAALLTLLVAMGLWWWSASDEPGLVDQGREAIIAESAVAGVLGARTAIPPAPLRPPASRAPGMGPIETPPKLEPATEPERGVSPAREKATLTAHLREQGVRMAGVNHLQSKDLTIPPEIFSHLSDPSTWLPELMKASSTVQNDARGEPTRLAVHDIEGDSILWDLGLRDGDVIVLVDGEIPRFSPTRAYDLVRRAQGALAALARGEPISLTVLRQQRPLHLFYQALNQE